MRPFTSRRFQGGVELTAQIPKFLRSDRDFSRTYRVRRAVGVDQKNVIL